MRCSINSVAEPKIAALQAFRFICPNISTLNVYHKVLSLTHWCLRIGSYRTQRSNNNITENEAKPSSMSLKFYIQVERSPGLFSVLSCFTFSSFFSFWFFGFLLLFSLRSHLEFLFFSEFFVSIPNCRFCIFVRFHIIIVIVQSFSVDFALFFLQLVYRFYFNIKRSNFL